MKRDKVPIPEHAPLMGGVYSHFKAGDLYKVIGLALDSNGDEWMVVYEPLYQNPSAPLFVRPLSEWGQIVEKNGEKIERFKKVQWVLLNLQL